jgi:apolipoprotein N-acyltransferase
MKPPTGTAMRRALPSAMLLGALAACGFAPLGLWPLTLACLALLIVLVERAPGRVHAAAIGWSFGFGHFCVGLNWIATAFTFQAAMPAWLGWIAVVLLSLYLAIYPALATLAAWFARRHPLALALVFAGAWIASEWLRATVFTGFAWNPLGVAWLSAAPPFARAAALVGTYGLSGLTVMVAAAMLALARQRWTVAAIAAAVPLAATGLAALATPALVPAATPQLRIVQPNVGQEVKWDPVAEEANFRRLVRLTGPPGRAPRLLLWPEVAIPWFLEEDEAARAALAALLGPRDIMLTGGQAVKRDAQGLMASATNSVFVLDPAGRLGGRYDKAHLVPYGEYLPMRPVLSALGLSRLAPGDMDFDAGPGPRDLLVPGVGQVGLQICYEIIFSGQVIDAAHRPRFLFNPSNDAWFGRWGPPQHLAQARLRAVEEGVPVIRATPTGISALIDADGRLLASLPWRSAGAIDHGLPLARGATPFARWGNMAALAFAAALLLAGFACARRTR